MPELIPQKEFTKVGINLSTTANQTALIEKIRKNTLTFAYGPAGTGKTYCALMEAARMILADKKRRISKIILIRPAVAAQEKLGFLPGELSEKIAPYLEPFWDNLAALEPEVFHEIKSCIEVKTLGFLRGVTFKGSFVILDEAQNTTTGQMKLFLTRIGTPCKVVVCGDTNQVDVGRDTGLGDALAKLKDIPKIAYAKMTYDDIMRNGIVRDILERYEGVEEGSVRATLDMDKTFPDTVRQDDALEIERPLLDELEFD